ncbi:MAG: NEW3 domain-containing protein [Candidatus Bipolaricaulia bacterium]
MRRSRALACGLLMGAVMALVALPVVAQDAQQTPSTQGQLTLTTPYPSQSVEVGSTVNLPLKVRVDKLSPQIVDLTMAQTADGWNASFIGDGRAVRAVYAQPDSPGSVSLKLEPSGDVQPGTYEFVVRAETRSADRQAELPVTLNVEEQVPPQLSFNVELPTLQGTPNGTITYQASLKNQGDRDLVVSLSADAPKKFEVTFKSQIGGQTVTSLPVNAGESKDLQIEVSIPESISAGEYQVGVQASAEDVQETQILNAVVEGEADLSISTSGDSASTNATIGETTSVQFAVRNQGSAPAENVSLNASSPSEWNVQFQTANIGTLQPGNEKKVTAQITPSQDTIAGDYFVTVTASSGGKSASQELRMTAQTTSMWGIVGIALVAVALGVVGLAIVRYGRR